MIIFAQLCYCIYYENYYNPFIMKNKKNNFYLMGVVFIAILGGLLFFRGRSRLCKNIWD